MAFGCVKSIIKCYFRSFQVDSIHDNQTKFNFLHRKVSIFVQGKYSTHAYTNIFPKRQIMVAHFQNLWTKIKTFSPIPARENVVSLTGIARLVHVNDLNLTTQILTFPCQTCSVYAMKQFGYPLKVEKVKIWVVRLRSFTWTSLAMPVNSVHTAR